MEPIDLNDFRDSNQRVDFLECVLEFANRVAEGDLANIQGMLIVWVDEDGLVDFKLPDSLDETAVVQMTSPIFVEMSLRMTADKPED